MTAVPVIAIDGPSGVGKGTVARRLAQRLGWHFLDSGALYRILALAARQAEVPLENGTAVAGLVPQLRIRFSEDGRGNEQIWLQDQEVAPEVRAETSGNDASRIAVFPAVRQALLQRQRDFRQPPGLVADGRDMGTVVFPDAVLKVFLDASAEERAQRRYRQLREAGREARIADLLAEIRARDERDRGRSEAPLRAAEDAVAIDTTTLSPEEVMAQVEGLLKARKLV